VTRYLLLRQGMDQVLVPESAIPLEQELHDAIHNHPLLLPADDLGLGRTLVVGKESGLKGGFADLILMDDQGEICIVEVKKEGNPDTKRVVAQLLDYASSLWRLPVSLFEETVVLPFLAKHSPETTFDELMRDGFSLATEDPLMPELEHSGKSSREQFMSRLQGNLNNGDFILVVAAPMIPPSVKRVLEYENAKGHRFYGIEFSYFSGSADCLVPRVVVTPPHKTQQGIKNLERILGDSQPTHRTFISDLVDRCVLAGAELNATTYDLSVRVIKGHALVTPIYIGPSSVWVSVTNPGVTFSSKPFQRISETLQELGIGSLTPQGRLRRIDLAKCSDEELDKLKEFLAHLVHELADGTN
jgi:hypothetical protein